MTTNHDTPVALTRRATSHDERAVLATDAKAAAGDRERQEVLRQAIRTGGCIVYERDAHALGVLVVKPVTSTDEISSICSSCHPKRVARESDAR